MLVQATIFTASCNEANRNENPSDAQATGFWPGYRDHEYARLA